MARHLDIDYDDSFNWKVTVDGVVIPNPLDPEDPRYDDIDGGCAALIFRDIADWAEANGITHITDVALIEMERAPQYPITLDEYRAAAASFGV